MKRLIIILCCVSSFIQSKSQIGLNGGFEETYVDVWTNILPRYWQPNHWWMIYDTTTPRVYEGNYAMGLYNRELKYIDYDKIVGRLQNRCKLNYIPGKFSAQIFYDPRDSNERFLLKAVLYNWNTENGKMDTIAVSYLQPETGGKIGNYKKFEAAFDYRKAIKPDSAEVTIYVSQKDAYQFMTVLIVDNVALTDTLTSLSVNGEIYNEGNGIISVYPNPASDEIQVNIGITENNAYTIILFDITGKEVLTKNVSGSNNPQFEIITKSLANGTYILKVYTDDGNIIASEKVIIVKP